MNGTEDPYKVFTTSTEEVARIFAMNDRLEVVPEWRETFYNWLGEHTREAQSEAWEQGYLEGANTGWQPSGSDPDNPYWGNGPA